MNLQLPLKNADIKTRKNVQMYSLFKVCDCISFAQNCKIIDTRASMSIFITLSLIYSSDTVSLKGQRREIFDLRFFHELYSPWPR
jgi:hypothetical protein